MIARLDDLKRILRGDLKVLERVKKNPVDDLEIQHAEEQVRNTQRLIAEFEERKAIRDKKRGS